MQLTGQDFVGHHTCDDGVAMAVLRHRWAGLQHPAGATQGWELAVAAHHLPRFSHFADTRVSQINQSNLW